MRDIDRLIRKHQENSRRLKEIYLGDEKMSYERSKQIQAQQGKEWKKTQFLRNLKKELIKQKEKVLY